MDFTIKQYTHLLTRVKRAGFSFQTFEHFLQNPIEKSIILRHDVDRLPYNSLATAKIECEMSIKGSYYFRIVKESFNPEIIRKIVDMGHEIGYHYETMDSVRQKTKDKNQKSKTKEDLIDEAYKEFCRNLEYFRTLYPVKTICMHGSPLSRWDNREIWKKYDYKSLGLIGEPYFDIDFSKVLYLTDTGRRWDGVSVSVRDKIPNSKFQIPKNNPESSTHNPEPGTQNTEHRTQNEEPRTQNTEPRTQNAEPGTRHSAPLTLDVKHTKDIIKAIEQGNFPSQAMLTIHPQRWNDSPFLWTKELIMQNIKNVVKWGLIKMR